MTEDEKKQRQLNDALLVACEKNTFVLEDIQNLVKLGADIHYRDDEPLKFAYQNKKFDVVQYLIEQGANIYCFQNAMLNFLVSENELDVLRNIIDHHKEPFDSEVASSLFLGAARVGHLSIMKYLTSIEPAITNRYNLNSCLNFAARGGHLDVMQYLVGMGANPHTEEDKPLVLATIYERLPVVQYLVIEHGCDVKLILEEAEQNPNQDIYHWCKMYLKTKKLNDKLQTLLPNKNDTFVENKPKKSKI